MVGGSCSSRAGADTSVSTWNPAFPQNEQRSWLPPGTGCSFGSFAGRPEAQTPTAAIMQGSQMCTPGPAMSLRTCRCSRPQNEQRRWSVGSWPRRRRHLRTPVLDDLVDALVTDAEGFGNLTHRCSCQVQASDRFTVFGLGSLELVLELSDPAGSGGGLSQQVLVNRHLSILCRHRVCLAGIDRLLPGALSSSLRSTVVYGGVYQLPIFVPRSVPFDT